MIPWLLLFLAFAFGNLIKFTFYSPDVHISILDISILVLTAISIFMNHKSFIVNLKSSRLTLPIFTFFFVGLASLLLSWPVYGQTAVVIGSMYLLRWVIYSLFFCAALQLFKAHELKKLVLGLGLITAAVSLGQYLFYPDVRWLMVLEWDPHYYRVVGSWLDPGFTGILLVFTLIYLLLNPLKSRILGSVCLIGSYLAFALTYSRSSYLAFLAAMAWIAWKQKGWQFFVKALLLLTITITLLPRAPGGEGVKLEREYSIWSRINSWKQALVIWANHPVLGVGFNTYRYAQGASLVSHAGAGADSSLLFVAATTGLFGLGAYLWYLKRLFSLEPIIYYLIPLLVHSLFLNSLFYPAIMVWLSLLIPSGSDSRPGQLQ